MVNSSNYCSMQELGPVLPVLMEIYAQRVGLGALMEIEGIWNVLYSSMLRSYRGDFRVSNQKLTFH